MFQIKVKQVNSTLHSKKQFTGGNSLKLFQKSDCVWTTSTTMGSWCQPRFLDAPTMQIIILKALNFTSGINNKDKEFSLLIRWSFYFLIPWGYHELWGLLCFLILIKIVRLNQDEYFFPYEKNHHINVKDNMHLLITKFSEGNFVWWTKIHIVL